MASTRAYQWLRPGTVGEGSSSTSSDNSQGQAGPHTAGGFMSRIPLATNYWANPTGSQRGEPEEEHEFNPAWESDGISTASASTSSSRCSSADLRDRDRYADNDRTVRQGKKGDAYATPLGIGSPRRGSGRDQPSQGRSYTEDYGDSVGSHLLGRTVPTASPKQTHLSDDSQPNDVDGIDHLDSTTTEGANSWTGYDWHQNQPSLSGLISHTIQKTRSGLNFVSASPMIPGGAKEETSPRKSHFPFMMRTNSQPGTKRGGNASGTQTPPSDLFAQPGRGALLVRSKSTDGAIEDPNHALSTRHLHQAIQLANTALDEQSSWVARHNISKGSSDPAVSGKASSSGDLDYILDVYLSALEYLMKALPKELLDMDEGRKQRVRVKMIECLERLGLVDETFVRTIMERNGMDTRQGALEAGAEGGGGRALEAPGSRAGAVGQRRTPSLTWQEAIISMAIASAVALKKSPLPGLASKGFTWTVKSAAALDNKYAIHERVFQASSAVLTKALDLDREYDIHVRLAEVIYVFYQATIRAMVAFARAEAYQEAGAGVGDAGLESADQMRIEEEKGKEEIRRAMEVLGQAGVDVIGLMQNQPPGATLKSANVNVNDSKEPQRQRQRTWLG